MSPPPCVPPRLPAPSLSQWTWFSLLLFFLLTRLQNMRLWRGLGALDMAVGLPVPEGCSAVPTDAWHRHPDAQGELPLPPTAARCAMLCALLCACLTSWHALAELPSSWPLRHVCPHSLPSFPLSSFLCCSPTFVCKWTVHCLSRQPRSGLSSSCGGHWRPWPWSPWRSRWDHLACPRARIPRAQSLCRLSGVCAGQLLQNDLRALQS